jgi:hypothetical protein
LGLNGTLVTPALDCCNYSLTHVKPHVVRAPVRNSSNNQVLYT